MEKREKGEGPVMAPRAGPTERGGGSVFPKVESQEVEIEKIRKKRFVFMQEVAYYIKQGGELWRQIADSGRYS